MTDRAPSILLDAIQRDLQPVRPLAPPAQRALGLLPVALILLVGMPLFWTWRTHAVLAPATAWGWSILESALSLVVLAAAFREAVPGRELSTRSLCYLVCIACAGIFLVNATTPVPETAPSHTWLRWSWECLSQTMAFSLPALAVPAWLVARALPNRPALTGALCGLGIGTMADAGLRLFCWDGDTPHVVLVHGGAIVILVAFGALSAFVVERVKARAARSAA